MTIARMFLLEFIFSFTLIFIIYEYSMLRVSLVLLAAAAASGFVTPQLHRLRLPVRRRGRGISPMLPRCSVAQWQTAADSNGLILRADALPAEDVRVLLEVAMSGDPKRKDTFAEVGGGRGEAMATALTLYPNLGQTALFLPEALKEVHEKMSVVIVSRMSAPLSYF
jgi:hypothetical protein